METMPALMPSARTLLSRQSFVFLCLPARYGMRPLTVRYAAKKAATQNLVVQVGSVIGKGGQIVKNIRDETHSKIRVCEGVPSCDDRVIVIAARDEDPAVEENNAQVPVFGAKYLGRSYIIGWVLNAPLRFYACRWL